MLVSALTPPNRSEIEFELENGRADGKGALRRLQDGGNVQAALLICPDATTFASRILMSAWPPSTSTLTCVPPSYMASTRAPVALGDDAAAQLAGARQHAVIGAELAVQDDKAMDLRFRQRRLLRQIGVDLGDAVGNQPIHLVLRGEIGVARVGDAPLVGPSADSGHVDVDERADHVASIAESDRFLDVGNELELVFEQLGREGACRPSGRRHTSCGR